MWSSNNFSSTERIACDIHQLKLALVPKLCCTVKPVLYNHVWLYKTGFSVNLELTFIGRWLPYTVTTLNRFHCTLSELADHGVVRVCCPLGGLL